MKATIAIAKAIGAIIFWGFMLGLAIVVGLILMSIAVSLRGGPQ